MKRFPAVLFLLLAALTVSAQGRPPVDDLSREDLSVVNPASGAKLWGTAIRMRGATGKLPAVVMVPGGLGFGSQMSGGPEAQALARAGLVVGFFDPDGRGKSAGTEDYNGKVQQDGLNAFLKAVTALPGVDPANVGVVSNSLGLAMAAGALARHPDDPPVKYFIDNEGPSDRFYITKFDDPKFVKFLGGHGTAEVDWWAEREAVRSIREVRCAYLRVQHERDHVHGSDVWHALDMIEAATAKEHGGKGRSPWTRINGPENEANRVYAKTEPPQWLPAVKGPDADTTVRFVREMAGIAEPAVSLPVHSDAVTVVASVPGVESGAAVKEFGSAFRTEKKTSVNGAVALALGRDPVYVLEGDASLPSPCPASESPFGFHPANVPGPGDAFGPAREIGIRWHRGFYAYWVVVQRTQADIDAGRFDWRANDREWGAVPESMTILANIGLPERRSTDGWRLTQPEEKYLAFVKAAVERYDGDGIDDMPGLKVPIRFWQVENEPDMRSEDWEGFAHIQEITYRAMKEACPEATVLMAGQTGGGIEVFDRFYEPLLKKLGGRSADVYDLHYYGDAKLDWKGVQPVLKHIRGRLDALGYAKTPIWITEMGSYSGAPGDEGGRRGPPTPAQTEREQARDVVKRYAFPLALGVKKVFWAFGLMEGFKHDDGYFDHTGFIYDGEFDDDRTRGVRKLAYFSYRKMTEVLDGADWSRAEILDLGPDVTAIRVPRGKGMVTIAWSDPPFTPASLLPADTLDTIRRRLDALAAEPTTADNAATRLRSFREILLSALQAGGPRAVENWAPKADVQAAEKQVREGAADAPAAVDALIRRALEGLK